MLRALSLFVSEPRISGGESLEYLVDFILAPNTSPNITAKALAIIHYPIPMHANLIKTYESLTMMLDRIFNNIKIDLLKKMKKHPGLFDLIIKVIGKLLRTMLLCYLKFPAPGKPSAEKLSKWFSVLNSCERNIAKVHPSTKGKEIIKEEYIEDILATKSQQLWNKINQDQKTLLECLKEIENLFLISSQTTEDKKRTENFILDSILLKIRNSVRRALVIEYIAMLRNEEGNTRKPVANLIGKIINRAYASNKKLDILVACANVCSMYFKFAIELQGK